MRIAEVPTSDEAKENRFFRQKPDITKGSDNEVLDLEENIVAPLLTLNIVSDEESEDEEEDPENPVTVEDTDDKGVRLEDTPSEQNKLCVH